MAPAQRGRETTRSDVEEEDLPAYLSRTESSRTRMPDRDMAENRNILSPPSPPPPVYRRRESDMEIR
jgi:hypothetical protein